MGKKNKKDKKGKGLEKTERKTDKNLGKKQKKILQNAGEDDITALIAEFQAEDKKKMQVLEINLDSPSPRSNFSFTACPDKEEILLYGGEYFNGKKTYVYSDLFIYNCKRDEWTKVDAPNSPPPRCGHQAVCMKIGSSPPTLWIFGGEFASPSQSQFYHYKDLWSFDLKKKKWKMVTDKNGPSARSGHRMVAWKKNLIVFGGFQDTGLKCKYLNDLWQFDTEISQWSLLKPEGDKQPSPRSGCLFLCSADSRNLYIMAGYTKERVKRDVDKGIIHSDIFQLKLQSVRAKCEGDKDSDVMRWCQIKPTGAKPTARCGMSGVITPVTGQQARALVFGGVWDEEEDEESVAGTFYDNLMSIDLERGKWYGDVDMKATQSANKTRRRADKNTEDNTEENSDDEDRSEETETDAASSNPSTNLSTISDGVFTLTVSNQSATDDSTSLNSDRQAMEVGPPPCAPGPRMNTGMAVIGHYVYLYGGMYEVRNRQVTLDDFFKLDLNRLCGWEILREGSYKNQEWLGSDSESDSDLEMSVDKPKSSVEKMDVESSSEDDDDELVENAPVPTSDENFSSYWSRTSDFWCQLIKTGLEEDDDSEDSEDEVDESSTSNTASADEFSPLIKKYALQTAKDFYRENLKSK